MILAKLVQSGKGTELESEPGWFFHFYRHLHFQKAGMPEVLSESVLQKPE